MPLRVYVYQFLPTILLPGDLTYISGSMKSMSVACIVAFGAQRSLHLMVKSTVSFSKTRTISFVFAFFRSRSMIKFIDCFCEKCYASNKARLAGRGVMFSICPFVCKSCLSVHPFVCLLPNL